jgi:hypothetical protein
MLTCAETRDLAPELALGVLGGAERAEALAHVDQCSQCRSLVGELTDAGELIPLLARETEPPPGFEDRVLAGLGGRRRRRGRWRWVAVIAATAAAATILSVATVRIVDRGRDAGPTETAVDVVRSAPMIGDDNLTVGWAFASDGRPAAVAITVDYLLPSGDYRITAVDGDGDPVTLGRMTVVDGRGVWSGKFGGSARGLAVVELVDAAGTTVCTATLV